ncbi:ABC transporter ATP-binding protein [Treponema rectale]|uniref:ABC transporter ATP-binding protein n=1 Tax=Treponema rectale TaxID=744512 RepID=A0A840SC28_9SPIR|nr:ABC-F family ATP-binding cassette domain-containing protein [Treponema rectale]MBB5217728.1 ATP-binding cassette subfamily F protein 3 [Treponema rectale]QOS40542.1 ABC transporter ATP-binding protein [Treponema rectale]
MAFVQFSKVSLSFGNRDILKDVSVNLATGTKAALTGANGAGKSTLIKIMAGLVEPDSGERIAQKDARVAYLPQSGLVHSGCTLKEEADKAFLWGYELQEKIDSLGEQMAKAPDNVRLAEEHSALLQKLEESGWYRREALAEQILLGLGFNREDFSKQTQEFSGGWQMRIALAKCLMSGPDILLLDEPTNYLDIEARNWLEKFLDDFKGGFLLVSHDRYFLDHTINEVYELFGGDLKRYPGNFTHYEQVREIELNTLIAEYEKQQAEIQHLQDFINRFGAKATKAAQAQERQKMLDKLLENEIVIPENLKKIHFSFPQAPHSGQIVLTLNGICKNYGSGDVLHNLDLVIEKNERLVVCGRNGEGKSTLLRILCGEDKDFTGEVKTGSGVQIGYFSQDSAEKISGTQTILDYMESRCPLELVPKIRDMLGAFLFRGDDVYKSINVLSGGEKSRIALLELLLRPVNLLILDEPTNHLDMHSKDVLLDALKCFGGTVIFVSHDRGFIEDLSTKVLELKGGKYRLFPGDYKYYMQRMEAEEAGEIPAAETSSSKKQTSQTVTESPVSETKRSWEEQKKLEAQKRKAEKELEKIESQITELEEKKSVLENQLASPEVYSNGEKAKAVQKQITELASQIDELTEKWESLA